MRLIAMLVTFACASVAGSWLVLSSPDKGETAFPGTNGLIAFQKDGAGTNTEDVYVMNADGSDQHALADSPENDRAPNWSPDGTKIAFQTRRDGDTEVYVMNADGSGQTNLTNDNSGNDAQPSWSPDGTMIAFNSTRDGNNEIYVMDADGSDPTNLTSSVESEGNPQWSPLGDKIAFNRGFAGSTDIYTIEPDGSDLIQLTDTLSDQQPSWSPDGSKIAFRSTRDGDSEIYVMDADGSDETNITNSPASDELHPAWSPDGTKILFASDKDGNQEIYVMNPDGTGQTRITNDPAQDIDPDWQPVQATPTPTESPTPSPTASPTPSPTPVEGNAIWGDDDCSLVTNAVDALKKLQDIASIPYEVNEPCFTIGDSADVQPAGFGQQFWGDTDCDGDVDAVDALATLRWIAALPVSQEPVCPEIGSDVLVVE